MIRTFSNMKKKYEKFYTKQTSTAATIEFLSKIRNRNEIFKRHFNQCEVKISLDEIIKSINFETNIKFPSNDGLRAEFYEHFSNELASLLLDVINSCEGLVTMDVTSRTRKGYRRL